MWSTLASDRTLLLKMFTDVLLTLALLFVDVVQHRSLRLSSSEQQICSEKNSKSWFCLVTPTQLMDDLTLEACKPQENKMDHYLMQFIYKLL